MQSLGIFVAPQKPGIRELILQLVALAEAHQIEVKLQQPCAHAIGRAELGRATEDEIVQSDVLVTLSGDGGVLKAARAAAPHKTPILAVDLGRLGFLSAVRPTELAQAFERLVRHEFVVEERLMLDARVLRTANIAAVNRQAHESTLGEHAPGKSTFEKTTSEDARLQRVVVGGSIGLNDAVVAKSALARILRLSIYVGDDLVAEMRADGLIISTPTGSTAYALSAGGPIVNPEVPLLLICPICAHSLTERPLVVAPDETIEVHAEWEGDEVSSASLEAMLTIDGQVGVVLQSGDIVRVRRSACTARLLHLSSDSFYGRLRHKMGWI